MGATTTGSPMTNQRARTLCTNATPIERRLWNLLRPLRQKGYHFRRQVPIGPYFADFASHDARVVIEADGQSHTDERYDRERDHFMRERGFNVFRVTNSEIVSSPEGVVLAIMESLKGIPPLAPTPVPSPRGGGVPGNRKLRTGLSELAARVGVSAPSPPSPLRGGAGGGGNHHQNREES